MPFLRNKKDTFQNPKLIFFFWISFLNGELRQLTDVYVYLLIEMIFHIPDRVEHSMLTEALTCYYVFNCCIGAITVK